MYTKKINTQVFTPGITLQRTSVTSVGHSYPYPELLEVLCAGVTKTRGTGTACLYLPGTSGSSVRPCHITRKFWQFCKTFIPVPGSYGSSVRLSYLYQELLWVLLDPCHNRYSMFCTRVELLWVLYACATIPGSSVTLPYPYPKVLEFL